MLKWFRKYNRYLVQVNYKSGHSERFWAHSFKVINDAKFEWKAAFNNQEPFLLGIDDIESVWVVNKKEGRNVWTG